MSSVMDSPVVVQPGPGRLGSAIRALAVSVGGAKPAREPAWRGQVVELVAPLRTAFTEHCAATEGAEGLYADVVADAPRLAADVTCLIAEHSRLDAELAGLAGYADRADADTERLRARAQGVLTELARHRQHDSDLVYDAYLLDIGGEQGT